MTRINTAIYRLVDLNDKRTISMTYDKILADHLLRVLAAKGLNVAINITHEQRGKAPKEKTK